MHCWWKCELPQPFWKSIWQYLFQVKLSKTSNLEIYPLEIKILVNWDKYNNIYCCIVCSGKRKQTKKDHLPWRDGEEFMIHPYREISDDLRK